MAASAGPARLRRSKTLIIQDRDGSLLKEPRPPKRNQHNDAAYRVEIPAIGLDEENSLIERVIAFAFDTLGARRVDVGCAKQMNVLVGLERVGVWPGNIAAANNRNVQEIGRAHV